MLFENKLWLINKYSLYIIQLCVHMYTDQQCTCEYVCIMSVCFQCQCTVVNLYGTYCMGMCTYVLYNMTLYKHVVVILYEYSLYFDWSFLYVITDVFDVYQDKNVS